MSDFDFSKDEIVIAQRVESGNGLAEQYSDETKPPLKGEVNQAVLTGQADGLTLKGTVQKGEMRLIPQTGRTDSLKAVEAPGDMSVRGWEYVAMPPTVFPSDSVKNAYENVSSKWFRGRHSIPVSIDLNGDHEGDAYDRYPLMWSIPGKLKLADSLESAVELRGKIMLRNERAELVETKDWYCVKFWDDHVDNLAHNIRADGYIMHFDNKTQSWWQLNQLRYIFNHVEGRGPCYGPFLPATSEWYCPDNIPNTVSPTLYGDFVEGDDNTYEKKFNRRFMK